MTDAARPPVRALLVGIDHYPGGGTPGAPSIPDLRGCVRDVERMERFLRRRLGVPAERIRKLTSPRPEAVLPGVAPPADRPTCQRLVEALEALVGEAEPGDEVLIHVSAHGVRQPTWFPGLKGEQGRDEAILPCDAADPHAPLLLDVVLGGFLHRLQERRAFVTLVLDTCHSGGALRSADVVWERSPGRVGGGRRPLYSGRLSHGDLETCWRRWRDEAGGGPVYRSHRLASRWLPAPRGYLLLAACGEEERAYELAVGEGSPGPRSAAAPAASPEPASPVVHGALSHFLLRELETGGVGGVTWEILFRRVRQRVRDRFRRQTPRLEGEGWRRVLGGAVPAPEPDLEVLGIADDGRLRLAVGSGHGLASGTLVAIHPSAGTGGDAGPHGSPDGGEGRPARLVAELETVGASESLARILASPGSSGEAPTPADRAVVSALLTQAPRARVVQAVAADPAATVAAQPRGCGPEARRRLSEVRRRVGSAGRGWLRWLEAESGVPDFQVTVGDGELQVLDPGGAEVPLRPPLPATRDSVAPFVDRLVHLARYRNVERLHNPDPDSKLADRVLLELGRVQDGYREGLVVQSRPWPDRSGEPVVEAGTWVSLTLANHGPFAVHLALLDLRMDGSIRMLLPDWAGCERFERGTVRHLAIRPELAAGHREGRGHLKLLVTRDPTDFRWLTLPPLDRPDRIYRSDGPRNALERLFAALVAEGRTLRSDDLAAFAVHEWTTRELRTRVVRRGSTAGGTGGEADRSTAGGPYR